MSYACFDERSKRAFEAIAKLQQDYPIIYKFLAVTQEGFKDLERKLRHEGIENNVLNDRCDHIVEASRLVDAIRDHLLETHLDYLLEQNPGGLN